MATAKFQRRYTYRELVRGDGMRFHPVSGDALRTGRMRFCRRMDRFFLSIVLGWGTEEVRLPRIAGRRRGKHIFLPGDRFPRNWKFHPETGEELQA